MWSKLKSILGRDRDHDATKDKRTEAKTRDADGKQQAQNNDNNAVLSEFDFYDRVLKNTNMEHMLENVERRRKTRKR